MTTSRLLIREITPDDWRGLQKTALDFCKSEYAVYDMPLPTEDGAIKELTKKFAESHLFFAVFLKDKAEMIGYVCFHKDGENYDLGYCFLSEYQGRGYAFESCKAVIEHIEQNYTVNSFTAGTALKNIPSVKLLEKLGFVLTGTEMLSFHKDASGNDIVFEGGNFVKPR
ncbi:MAG: GNAT family N-acetyltransferase [Clostridia bacterium]|nr:GNAT family N-acetyltransferase [Clostridia bacterium]